MSIFAYVADAHIVAHAHVLGAIAELDDPFFETQVVGDFREPEARLYLEHTLGASVTDAEWAEIVGRCIHACIRQSFPALSPVYSDAMEGWIDGCRVLPYCLVMCRCVEAMQAVCEGPQGTPQTSRTGHKVDFVC